MAAPPEVTIKNLTGDWNKTLSGDFDEVLAFQGVGWLLRRTIGLATITLHVKQYTDDAGVTHVDIDQTASGGIKGTSETRTLDWTLRPHEDYVFGKIEGKARWVTLSDAGDDFQKQGFLETDEECGGPDGQRHVQAYANSNDNKWDADQIWGFEMIDGARYYTRRVVVKKTDGSNKVLKIRLVYNWAGKSA
ncbi:hypothetical protein HYFRA_00008060 [Hymenoscyphus fraxineus]|uniref:Uncharacterized protein n=1 Tax=Hymenoscyphus fraxineus TaxID=746836 RepID=A0A9N9KNW0_9HELO|nr:hypothetical protein HYFRA_00008060 [Hymenoscyphus fraxineus]